MPFDVISFVLSCILGIFLGIAITYCFYSFKISSIKKLAKEIFNKTELEAEVRKKENDLLIKQRQIEQQRALEQTAQKERQKIQREEERLKQREDKIESRMNLVEKKLSDIEKREAILIARKTELDEAKKIITDTHNQLITELERVACLTLAEAKQQLTAKVANEIQEDTAHLARRLHKEAEEEAEQKASAILATAINRLAVSCASETTVCTVAIPNEEMKGRIIGREGRNIRALEQATGINFIIDDTPSAIVLSGFDPFRRAVAKLALTELVIDGRIHPTRIEEAVDKATLQVQKQIKQHGEDAALRAGAMNLHPELILLLGKLKLRYSFGQNVLDHSLEVSHLMGMMAEELHLDVKLAKRIGLLHDIGKAVSHDVEGTHAIIGHNLALKYNESREVANGVGSHHFEMEPITVEGSLCSAADALSASRPGARIEAVEEYIKRLKQLEDLAFEFPSVDKAYAMQAGREIRIVVLPDMIDDTGVVNLARDLTKKIEQNLSYPGKIKVTVIREKRAVEYAI